MPIIGALVHHSFFLVVYFKNLLNVFSELILNILNELKASNFILFFIFKKRVLISHAKTLYPTFSSNVQRMLFFKLIYPVDLSHILSTYFLVHGNMKNHLKCQQIINKRESRIRVNKRESSIFKMFTILNIVKYI
jgi:hypothetical protein